MMQQRRPCPKGWNRTSPELLVYFERKLLSHLSVPFRVYPVQLQSKNLEFKKLCKEYINTLEVVSCDEAGLTRKPTIVIIHGFASALATFVNLFQPLSNVCKVFAIDLLGFGRSSKPQFPTGNNNNNNEKGMAAESLFVESIEVWRLQMGIDSMILCAHSFGAYIATSYSHKFPDAVQGLVLFEPWGFPLAQDSPVCPPSYMNYYYYLYYISSMVTESHYYYFNIKTGEDSCIKRVSLLQQINPLRMLKLAGPIAFPIKRLITRNLFEKTFNGIGSGDEMIQYLYHSNVQCTGDSGFMSLLSPFYLPLRPISVSCLNSKLHITLIYGSNSWIDPRAGDRVLQERGYATFVEIIPGAGHQVYAEQLDLFLAAVLRAIERISKGH